jgi:hypothetical protein
VDDIGKARSIIQLLFERAEDCIEVLASSKDTVLPLKSSIEDKSNGMQAISVTEIEEEDEQEFFEPTYVNIASDSNKELEPVRVSSSPTVENYWKFQIDDMSMFPLIIRILPLLGLVVK